MLKLRERSITPPERRPASRPAVRRPTPIRISRTAWNLIVVTAVVLLVLVVWAVPIVLVVALGGFALALVLSFPVALFARILPRGLAILLAFLILLAILLFVAYVFLPLLVAQAAALVSALPGLVQDLERYVIRALEALDTRALLSSAPEEIAARLAEDLRTSLGVIAGNVLGHTMGVVFGTFSFALTLFGSMVGKEGKGPMPSG